MQVVDFATFNRVYQIKFDVVEAPEIANIRVTKI